MDMEVTDLPQPDSPTDGDGFAGGYSEKERHRRRGRRLIRVEMGLEVETWRRGRTCG